METTTQGLGFRGLGFLGVYTGVILGLFWGYVGIMERQMETTT